MRRRGSASTSARRHSIDRADARAPNNQAACTWRGTSPFLHSPFDDVELFAPPLQRLRALPEGPEERDESGLHEADDDQEKDDGVVQAVGAGAGTGAVADGAGEHRRSDECKMQNAKCKKEK